MERYHELKPLVHKQLKGHFFFLYGWMLLGSLLITILQKLPLFFTNSMLTMFISIVTSILYFFINVTVCFLFIQNIRGIRFRKEDIKYSFSKIGNEILFGFVASFFQSCMNLFLLFFVNIPMLYLLLSIFVNLFFLTWFTYAAYLIYDQHVKLQELIKQPLVAMKNNAMTIFLAGGFFVLWNVIVQVILSSILEPVLTQYASLDAALVALMKDTSNYTSLFVSVAVIMIIFVIVQYAILVYYNTYIANIYESEKELLK